MTTKKVLIQFTSGDKILSFVWYVKPSATSEEIEEYIRKATQYAIEKIPKAVLAGNEWAFLPYFKAFNFSSPNIEDGKEKYIFRWRWVKEFTKWEIGKWTIKNAFNNVSTICDTCIPNTKDYPKDTIDRINQIEDKMKEAIECMEYAKHLIYGLKCEGVDHYK
jgi:hypothetical protein